MTEAPASGIRILVGAGSFADAAAALQVLKIAARQRQITLGGMLIVDQQLLALCRMPNQRIISGTGALVISPSPGQVSALIEADAKAFRRSLEELAGPIGATWMFQQAMGDLVGESLRARAAWDIIVFGHSKIHKARGRIVVISSGEARNEELTGFADALAGQKAAERVDLIVGEAQDRETSHLSFANVEAAFTALSRMNAQVVLVDLSKGLLKDADDLQRLLDAARCPVFVFGAASAGASLEHGTHSPPAPAGNEDKGGD